MKFIIIALIAVFSIACDETTSINFPTSPSGDGTTIVNPNGTLMRSTIEFRVTGNATSARIRYSTSIDGMTQVQTMLPFINRITTNQPSIFVSLEASPVSYPLSAVYPYLAVQIFVNGTLFREATSSDMFLNPVSVSGTWRFSTTDSSPTNPAIRTGSPVVNR